MKGKPSFDFKAIQSFLLAHVEKFGFALVVVCLFFLLSGAVSRKGYERTPTDLINIANQADEHIKATPPPPPEQMYKGTPTLDYAKGIRDPIENLYGLPRLWTPFIWPQLSKRGEPLLYTVDDLRAAAGHGGIRVKPNEASPIRSRAVTGQRWVVITGLIPYEKQLDAYAEAFGDAEFQNPDLDTPRIIYYRVERAVLDGPDDAAEPNWVLLHLGNRMAQVRDLWNGTMGEVVNEKYLHKGRATPIAFPLPPLANKAFGREVAHAPEIPLAVEDRQEKPAKADAAGGPAADDDPASDLPTDVPPEARKATVVVDTVEREKVPYRLFRFFDMDVQPGKHYRYRVKLMLDNPNYDLDEQFLVEDSLREAAWLETDWSEPTDVVSVPRDARVLAGSVKPSPGGRVTREPKATVGIPFFFFEAGAELYEHHEVTRGRHLNFPGHELPEDMIPDGFGDGAAWLAAAATGAKGDGENTGPPKVDFNTETVLLDMIGGERLPGGDRDLTRPGLLLLLGSEGNLIVRDELDDKAEFEGFEETIKKEPDRKTRPGRDRPNSDEEPEDTLFMDDISAGGPEP